VATQEYGWTLQENDIEPNWNLQWIDSSVSVEKLAKMNPT
jgi:hypothetical protein